MAKPLIGITVNQFLTQGGTLAGTKRQFVSDAYVQSVLRAGGVPILLPIITEQAVIEQQLQVLDGLLLTGGGDTQPQLFGEEPVRELGEVIPERDFQEILLAKMSLAAGKPMLGICRGCQILNIALGGTIYQHLTADEATVQHDQNSPGDYAGHTVVMEAGSKLAAILGLQVLTNSFHHQAVKGVAAELRVSARTQDGIIEAIEHVTADFAIGVQWHPELMIDKYPNMLNLFKEFVGVAERK